MEQEIKFRYKSPHPSSLDRQRWKRVREELIELKGDICLICNENKYDDVDHIVPIFMGGDHWDLDNLQPVCRICHKQKNSEEQKKANRFPRIETSKNSLRKKARKLHRKNKKLKVPYGM